MNIKTIASLFLVSSIALTSCKKELEPQESTPIDSTTVANTSVTDPNTVVPTEATPVQPNQPVQVNPGQVQAAPQQPATVAKGMNPAHGQPNHRCDIAVGAPLNSPPGKTPAAAPQVVTPPQNNGSATVKPITSGVPSTLAAPTSASPVVTAPGMNPPHGQAGHDCAVAVGAPLPKKE